MIPLSIIIPVLNEERGIGDALDRLRDLCAEGVEVIVVDGGSVDATVNLVHGRGFICISSEPGRALQMNVGARHCAGRLLAFLHADTRVSAPAMARLAAIAREGSVCWGRFDVRIDGGGGLLRLIGLAMNLRSRLTQVATGDQLIFVHRSLFTRVGAYPSIPLMEDVALCKRLRRLARARCCDEIVFASPRRWQRHGAVKTMLLMWWLRLRYVLGADPTELARVYRTSETDTGAGGR